MLRPMPDTTWLPWCVTQAKPCTRASSTDATIPAPSPAHAEPVTAAVAAAANAEPSILPSSPMSTTPDRSAKSPPSAARTSGAAPRTVAAASKAGTRRKSLIGSDPLSPAGGEGQSEGVPVQPSRTLTHPSRWKGEGVVRRPAEERLHRSSERLLERAADQDDQPL